jgi:hypothetical protein
MKILRLLPLIVALAAATLPAVTASAAGKTPAVTIDQALKAAEDYLQQHGAAADHQIISITLEAASLGATYWYAHWSPAITDGGKRQLGLRVDMDGSVTLIVSGSSGAGSGGSSADYDPPVGQRPQGARNMR